MLDNAPARRFDPAETPFALNEEAAHSDPAETARSLALVFRATEKLAQATHLNEFLKEVVEGLVKAWLDTPFEGGRHQRRVDKIEQDL